MRPLPILAGLVLSGLLLVACDGGGDAEPITNPVPTATVAADDRRSGIPELDAVLAALFSGDREAVAALIAYTPVECEAEPIGLGSPPMCPEGVADGTPVDVFPAAVCEGFYRFPDEIDGVVDAMSTPGAELYAVYEVGDTFPPGTHAAVYTGAVEHARPDDAYVVYVTGGRITGYQAGCITPDEFVARASTGELLVAPPTPAANRTGLLVVDAVLDAVEAGDAETLDRLVRFTPMACTATPQGIGAPPLCREDEAPETIVAVFPLLTCELEYRREDELGSLGRFTGGTLFGVYAAPDGGYWILYEFEPQGGVGLLVEGDAITSADPTCGGSVEEEFFDFYDLDINMSLVEP